MPAGVALLFVGYLGGFVILPGWLAYAALTGSARFDLRSIAVGWALGYVLEIGAFALTASAHVRGAFAFEPLVVAVAAAPRLRRLLREQLLFGERAPAWGWGVTAMAAIALVATAEGFYSLAALPTRVAHAIFPEDVVFPLALAAEALHHWPMQTPDLAGTPLYYHYFVNLDMAAVTQVTGISLPLVVLRLAPLPMVALVALLLAALGRAVSSRAAVAVLAPALVLFVTLFDPVSTAPHWPVLDLVGSAIVYQLYTSPPFLLGAVLLLAVAVEVVGMLERGTAPPRLRWLLLVLLLAGCPGAKAPVLPIVTGAFVLGMLYARRFDRARVRVAATGAALAFALWIAAYVVIYGGNAHTTSVWPLWSARHEFGDITDYHGPLPLRAGLYLLAGTVAILQATSVLLPGLVARFWRRRPTAGEAWLLAGFVVGVATCYLTRAFGNDQFFFLFFGYLLAGPLAAAGYVGLWDGLRRRIRLTVPRPVLALFGTALVLAVLAADTPWRSPHRIEQTRAGAATLPPAGSPEAYSEVSAGLYRGLAWLRDHTPTDAVFAVDNLYSDPADTVPRACYYTAFTERPAMLSCEYGVTPPTSRLFPPSSIYPPLALALADPSAHPFAERFRLDRAIFQRADSAALRTAASRYGVRYLLVDLTHHGTQREVTRLERVSRLVFDDGALAVLEVRPS